MWGAHWRHLTNTTEPSMCGGDAAITHVDAVYCYRSSSVVCRSVGRFVTRVSLAKTAEPI